MDLDRESGSLPATEDPYVLATALYERSLAKLGYGGGYRYLDVDIRMTRSAAWWYFRFSLLRKAFAICNERAAMRYMLAKKNLVSLRARALTLAKAAQRPVGLLLGKGAARLLALPLVESSKFKVKGFFPGHRQSKRKLSSSRPVVPRGHAAVAVNVHSFLRFRRRHGFLPEVSSGLVFEQSVDFFPRSHFVLLTKSFFKYLLFFFCRGSLPLAKPRPFYALR